MNDDNLIIQAVLDGDIEKYAEIMECHQKTVIAIVSKRIPEQDVENVVQECFIRAYNSLASYSGKSPFANWLSRISVRTCCDFWRRQEKHKKLVYNTLNDDHVDWLEHVSQSESIEAFKSLTNSSEAREMLNWALGHLSAEDRTLIETIYFEGWSLSEVAKTLEWGIAKTKVRAMRARRKLRKVIESLWEK